MNKFVLAVSATMILVSTNVTAANITGSMKISSFGSEEKAVRSVKVPLIDAIQTAKKSVAGQVIKAEVDEDDGYLVYKIEILKSDGKKEKVYVDPGNGKILVTEID